MEDSELKLESVKKFFDVGPSDTKVITKKGFKVVTKTKRSKLNKILSKYNIYIPTHLDQVVNQEILKELNI